MMVASILSFFAQYGAAAILDRLIYRVSGEARRQGELDAVLSKLDRRQDEILEGIHEQVEAHYTLGLVALQKHRTVKKEVQDTQSTCGALFITLTTVRL